MRVYANKFNDTLRNGAALRSFYLIFGDEPQQKVEIIDTIRLTAKQQGFSERISFTTDAKFDWQQLEMEFNSLSLFAERRLIEVDVADGKVSAKAGKLLEALAEQANPDTILLFHGPKLGAEITRAKWFKAFDAQGIYVPTYPVEGQHFTRWLQQRAQHYRLQITNDGIKLMSDFFAGNLLAAAQELEKLALLIANTPQQRINAEFLEPILLNQSQFNVFQLVDELLNGNQEKAVKMLIRLQGEGIEPVIISWALTREILQLYDMRLLLEQGTEIADVLKQFNVWKNRQNLLATALQQLSLPHIEYLLKLASELDTGIKSNQIPDPYIALCHLCLAFRYHTALQPYELNPQAGQVF